LAGGKSFIGQRKPPTNDGHVSAWRVSARSEPFCSFDEKAHWPQGSRHQTPVAFLQSGAEASERLE
jgi:hypothetical protein